MPGTRQTKYNVMRVPSTAPQQNTTVDTDFEDFPELPSRPPTPATPRRSYSSVVSSPESAPPTPRSSKQAPPPMEPLDMDNLPAPLADDFRTYYKGLVQVQRNTQRAAKWAHINTLPAAMVPPPINMEAWPVTQDVSTAYDVIIAEFIDKATKVFVTGLQPELDKVTESNQALEAHIMSLLPPAQAHQFISHAQAIANRYAAKVMPSTGHGDSPTGPGYKRRRTQSRVNQERVASRAAPRPTAPRASTPPRYRHRSPSSSPNGYRVRQPRHTVRASRHPGPPRQPRQTTHSSPHPGPVRKQWHTTQGSPQPGPSHATSPPGRRHVSRGSSPGGSLNKGTTKRHLILGDAHAARIQGAFDRQTFPGATTKSIAAKISTLYLEEYDKVTLVMGSNDCLNQEEVKSTCSAIMDIVEQLHGATKAKVTVLAVPPAASKAPGANNRDVKSLNSMLAINQKRVNYSFIETPFLWYNNYTAHGDFYKQWDLHFSKEGGKKVGKAIQNFQ